MNLARRNLSIGEILPPMRNLMEGGFLVEPFELAAGRIAVRVICHNCPDNWQAVVPCAGRFTNTALRAIYFGHLAGCRIKKTSRSEGLGKPKEQRKA
jgi:hypothetical protein